MVELKKRFMKIKATNKETVVIVFLFIIYFVGIVGSFSPLWRNTVLPLSPITLLLSFLALIYTTPAPKKPIFLFILFSAIIGFVVELIGIHTEYLFGSYHYQQNLGVKIAEVPIVISINWALITLGAAQIAALISENKYARIVLAASVMLLFDIIMEPVAIKSQFWTWSGGIIPTYNYVSWFLVGIFLQVIYFQKIVHRTNNVLVFLFTLMMIFFIVLNFY